MPCFCISRSFAPKEKQVLAPALRNECKVKCVSHPIFLSNNANMRRSSNNVKHLLWLKLKRGALCDTWTRDLSLLNVVVASSSSLSTLGTGMYLVFPAFCKVLLHFKEISNPCGVISLSPLVKCLVESNLDDVCGHKLEPLKNAYLHG